MVKCPICLMNAAKSPLHNKFASFMNLMVKCFHESYVCYMKLNVCINDWPKSLVGTYHRLMGYAWKLDLDLYFSQFTLAQGFTNTILTLFEF